MTLAPLVVAAAPVPLASWRKLALAGEILALYARIRWTMRDSDIRRTVAGIRRSKPSGQSGDSAAYVGGLRYGRAVRRVLEPLPVSSSCLMQSLVLCGLLARRGVRSSVVIGVRPGDDFGAHAWVELGGRPLLPAHEAEYERLMAL